MRNETGSSVREVPVTWIELVRDGRVLTEPFVAISRAGNSRYWMKDCWSLSSRASSNSTLVKNTIFNSDLIATEDASFASWLANSWTRTSVCGSSPLALVSWMECTVVPERANLAHEFAGILTLLLASWKYGCFSWACCEEGSKIKWPWVSYCATGSPLELNPSVSRRSCWESLPLGGKNLCNVQNWTYGGVKK